MRASSPTIVDAPRSRGLLLPWMAAAALLCPGAQATVSPTASATTAVAAVVGTAAMSATEGAARPPEAWKIMVREAGVYSVTFEDLAATTPGLAPFASEMLALSHRGESIPLWVEDSGDGMFGAGDSMEFVGEHLAGEISYWNEHSRDNVYRLSSSGGGERMRELQPKAAEGRPAPTLVRFQHLEEERLRGRFSQRQGVGEFWHWARLTHIDKERWGVDIDLSAYDREVGPVSLALDFQGWSTPLEKTEAPLTDHSVLVVWNNRKFEYLNWNGQTEQTLHVPEIPLDKINPENRLELIIPRRQPPGGRTIIDVVLLNWIQLRYPHNGRLAETGVTSMFLEGDETGAVELKLKPELPTPVIYGTDGTRQVAHQADSKWPLYTFDPGVAPTASPAVADVAADVTDVDLSPAATGSRQVFIRIGDSQRPTAIEVDRASTWRDTSRQADYLMITHPSLRSAIKPLAEHHRQSGLEVEVVDVDDIYDEFSHGVLDPRAIRDFISHAYHEWTKPAPRFVLLVGDASWDPHNSEAHDEDYADWTYRRGEVREFVKNESTPYKSSSSLGHRQLIPTWNTLTSQGYAASDNIYVAVDGDDIYPDLAIGRFPVTEPDEVAAIVAKTIDYDTSSEVGPWRRNVLWVTNEHEGYQRLSDKIAHDMDDRGFASHRVYPSKREKDNAEHQQALIDALDEGQLLVHFYGHGGRYIWRTGPPDLDKNHDLFTLDHLDELANPGRLPVVLSMTCYSAPFDHPSADSIGEKFLRVTDKGAVAVIAASWRNRPSWKFSRLLIEGMTVDGLTVGETMVKAKGEMTSQMLVDTYNLLGDPAITVSRPKLPVDVTVAGGDGSWRATIAVEWPEAGAEAEAGGRALVEWIDAEDRVIESAEVAAGASFEATFDGDAKSDAEGNLEGATGGERVAESVRVYVWDEAQQLDGIASRVLASIADGPFKTTSQGASSTP